MEFAQNELDIQGQKSNSIEGFISGLYLEYLLRTLLKTISRVQILISKF